MLGRLSVALLLVASPALANDPAPAAAAPEAAAQEFKTRKVCRTVEVAGSFIPRTHCVLKKVPVKKPAPDGEETAKQEGGAEDGAAKQQ